MDRYVEKNMRGRTSFLVGTVRNKMHQAWPKTSSGILYLELFRNSRSVSLLPNVFFADYKCPSPYGSTRLAQIFVQALVTSGQTPKSNSVESLLWKGLTNCLAQSSAKNAGRTKEWALKLAKVEGLSLEPLKELACLDGGPDKSDDRIVPAIALGVLIEKARDATSDGHEWLSSLLTYSLQYFSRVDACRSWLRELPSQTVDETVLPALLVKLKSHPDKALTVLESWISCLKLGLPSSDWGPAVQKQLQSTKDENRAFMHSIVASWAKSGGSAAALVWAQVYVEAKISLAPTRLDLFNGLTQLASSCLSKKRIEIDATEKPPLSKAFVDGVSGLVSKETANKAVAWKALVAWHAVARSATVKVDDKDLTSLAETMAASISKLNENASIILAALNDQFRTVEARKSAAVDLWNASANWSKALKKVVESATAKKPEPPLLGLYWTLLYHSSEGQKDKKLPVWTTKLLNGPSSLLYSSGTSGNGAIVIHCICMAVEVLGFGFFSQKAPVTETMAECLASSRLTASDSEVVPSALGDLMKENSSEAKKTAKKLVGAIYDKVKSVSDEREKWEAERNTTRQLRESEARAPTSNTKHTLPWNSIRKAAQILLPHCVNSEKVWLLVHVGASLRTDGLQRKALVDFAEGYIGQLSVDEALCRNLLVAGNSSEVAHRAMLSLFKTLGQVSLSIHDEADDEGISTAKTSAHTASEMMDILAPLVADDLTSYAKQVREVGVEDVQLFKSNPDVPFVAPKVSDSVTEKKKRLSEEEEWEERMKKELAAKSKGESKSSTSVSLSQEDKKIVEAQKVQREELQQKLSSFRRALQTVEHFCLSDIEIGNNALVFLSRPALEAASMECPVMMNLPSYKVQAYSLLKVMASCVYEVDEAFAFQMAQALIISSSFPSESSQEVKFGPLPSPCQAAATVLQELAGYGEALSSGSFVFSFPVIRAALAGPRTPPGCEGALSILGFHAEQLSGDELNPTFVKHRKEMVTSVLELLRHDRAQSFQEPSAFEVLVSCYRIDGKEDQSISTAELAPLLDERGALGSRNCRVGAMMALAEIAGFDNKLVKSNPLAENRVWLNCFDTDESIRNQARRTWSIMNNGNDDLPPPSPLYAAPLLPLLSADDSSIASAASKAFAHALGQHPGSVGRNIENLCKAYIEAYPSLAQESASASKSNSLPSIPAPPPRKPKPISTGLPKKKTKSKTPAGIANIGKPKVATKKKVSSAATKALLKPKQERKLDQDALASQFGGAVSNKSEEVKDSPSKIAIRLGILHTLTATTALASKLTLDETCLRQLSAFLAAYGIAETNETVKTSARNTFREIIACYGGSDGAVSFLLPQLESVLKSGVAAEDDLKPLSTDKIPRDVAAQDRRKEGAVVALGSVALHLKGPDNEEKVDSTIDLLLSTLSTPSEEVQASVADALSKLMKKGRTQQRLETIVGNLLRDCLHGDTLAVRRGSAYGLSAAVKGSGIGTLKKLEVVKSLEEAFETGNSNNKEGALFAIELLSSRLGLLFEPYVIVLLPSLLKSFSDGSDFVRKAAAHTAGLIMSKLSAHGVKLVTPAVLDAFHDSAWRTKQASIHMLGAMSHLAPKQLAAALPKIVPQLTEAFGDTHPKVKASAEAALDEISTVVRNPEIKSISSSLLKALTDPADYTQPALERLIGTEFLHSIDAPSLALIVPILHRGLRERGANVKRMGGLIAGNICTMINDPRDFVPYVPTLLPDLQVALLDPIPDVRSTAAKALGSLTRSLGDQILPELRPWLVKKLRDDACSSAERSGAAQGLTEVLIASGTTEVDDVMRNEILPLRSHPESSTREGVLWMLSFLPPALGQGFAPLIDISLPALVSGLSDDNEPVRDVAMRAGRVLIRSHGKVHVDKILPSLETGLGDLDYRIRVASLSLLGDLLSMIGGTSVVKGDGDTQDDIRRAEKAQAQIALVLGAETRKRVLSELYLARSDSVHAVRQSALQVWKTVVSVTVRTLRDILPVLVNRIIEGLASGDEERTAVAGLALGDVVTKLGETVLPTIIPVLRDTMKTGNAQTKRGVCVGLNEVIKCSTKDQISKYLGLIVNLQKNSLSDDDADVRSMAASSFQSLYSMVGSRAFDEVVPSLMVALEYNEDEESKTRALNGLVGILAVRSRELLPYIVPRLIKRPISINQAQAISSIAEVTGSSIFYHFSQIMPAILGDLADTAPGEDEDRVLAVRDAAGSLCRNVGEAGIKVLISEIASKCPSDKAAMRRESCLMFETLVSQSKFWKHYCLNADCVHDEEKYYSGCAAMKAFYYEISV